MHRSKSSCHIYHCRIREREYILSSRRSVSQFSRVYCFDHAFPFHAVSLLEWRLGCQISWEQGIQNSVSNLSAPTRLPMKPVILSIRAFRTSHHQTILGNPRQMRPIGALNPKSPILHNKHNLDQCSGQRCRSRTTRLCSVLPSLTLSGVTQGRSNNAGIRGSM